MLNPVRHRFSTQSTNASTQLANQHFLTGHAMHTQCCTSAVSRRTQHAYSDCTPALTHRHLCGPPRCNRRYAPHAPQRGSAPHHLRHISALHYRMQFKVHYHNFEPRCHRFMTFATGLEQIHKCPNSHCGPAVLYQTQHAYSDGRPAVLHQ